MPIFKSQLSTDPGTMTSYAHGGDGGDDVTLQPGHTDLPLISYVLSLPSHPAERIYNFVLTEDNIWLGSLSL